MAILMIHDNENDTLEHYDQVIQKLAETGQGHPPGRQSHVAVRKGDGYLVADVWESQEAFDDFARVLNPAVTGGRRYPAATTDLPGPQRHRGALNTRVAGGSLPRPLSRCGGWARQREELPRIADQLLPRKAGHFYYCELG